MKINSKKIDSKMPVCVGSGLVALDVILNNDSSVPVKICAGGSCGNIISILSFLGWKSKPIARLSNNNATIMLLEDLANFNIDIELLTISDDGVTPVIIHRILKDKLGNSIHKFEFRIPKTNKWLPQYKPVLASSVDSIIQKQNNSNVFYFDRVSRAIINLAKHYKNLGALIVFEPSSIKDDKQFKECLEVCHILKFSNERIKNFNHLFNKPSTDLEIETLGGEGLRYRMKRLTGNEWTIIPPHKLNYVVDSAGAGDWCTAGIINQLGFNGSTSFFDSTKQDVEEALIIGQALGAINCMYEGARGIMYNMDYDNLIETFNKLNNKIEVTPINNLKTSIMEPVNFDFEALL